MSITDIKDVGGWITYFLFFSTVVLNLGIFIFVALYDYAFIKIYDIAVLMNNAGNFGSLGSIFLDSLEMVINNSQVILGVFDYMWLFSFVTMIFFMFVASYHLRRPDRFSLLFYLFYGVMALLFILSIVLQITGWWNDVFLNGVLANVNIPLPFYTWYLTNVGVVNLIIIIICIILSIIDFDNLAYNFVKEEQRKDFFGGNDEI